MNGVEGERKEREEMGKVKGQINGQRTRSEGRRREIGDG